MEISKAQQSQTTPNTDWFDKDETEYDLQNNQTIQEKGAASSLIKDLTEIDQDEDDEAEFKDALESAMSAPPEYDIEQALKLKEKANEEFKLERYDECLEIYDEAISLCPTEDFTNLAIFHNNKGICYTKLNQNKQATKEFSKAVEINPNYVKPRALRMKIYKDEEEYDKALEDAKKIEELDPMHPNIHKTVIELDKLQKEKFDKMKNEVMGNLKNLGNSLLGKFGMSLDNFKLNQNPDGTYNIQYQNQ